MKAIVIGIKYSDTVVEARLLIPPEYAGASGESILDDKTLEKKLITIAAHTLENIKLATKEKNAKIILYVNDEIIFAHEPDSGL